MSAWLPGPGVRIDAHRHERELTQTLERLADSRAENAKLRSLLREACDIGQHAIRYAERLPMSDWSNERYRLAAIRTEAGIEGERE